MEEKIGFIFRGAPGNGKSYLAEQTSKVVCSADSMPGLYYVDEKGEKRYNLDLQKNSHEWCREQAEAAMQRGESPIAVANTSMQRRWYQTYMDLFQQYGYSVQIIHCEGVILPDGKPTISIHDVPRSVVNRMRSGFEPYVHVYGSWKNLANPHSSRVLRVFDKDRTLVFNPDGGIPKVGFQKPIPGIKEKMLQFQAAGDLIVVASNQGGLATKNKETGKFYKTLPSFQEEAFELLDLFPEIDLLLASPDLEGESCLILQKESDAFFTFNRPESMQPFRKPEPGMLQYASKYFAEQFSQAIFYGNSQDDYLAALAADMPYLHVHDLLYS